MNEWNELLKTALAQEAYHSQKQGRGRVLESNVANHFTKIETANVQRAFIQKMCSALRQ